jgi:hypothetical protein
MIPGAQNCMCPLCHMTVNRPVGGVQRRGHAQFVLCRNVWKAEFLSDLLTEPTFVTVRVTLQLTVSQSVRLGVEPLLGLMTRYLFLYESRCPVRMGRPV